MEMGQYTIFAGREVEQIASTQVRKLRLQNDNYFNSGMLLFDINKWNSQKVFFDTVKFLSSKISGALEYPDQDALNIILDNGRVKFLDNKWNFILNDQNKAVPENTILLHFVTHPKPWSLRYEASHKDLYFHYMNMSPWADLRLQLPTNYREMRLYARQLWKKKMLANSIYWYGAYAVVKILYKLKLIPYNAVNLK